MNIPEGIVLAHAKRRELLAVRARMLRSTGPQCQGRASSSRAEFAHPIPATTDAAVTGIPSAIAAYSLASVSSVHSVGRPILRSLNLSPHVSHPLQPI